MPLFWDFLGVFPNLRFRPWSFKDSFKSISSSLLTPIIRIKKNQTSSVQVETIQLGIWKVLVAKSPMNPLDISKRWNRVTSSFHFLKRLAIDVYTLDPCLSVLYVLTKIWWGLESALSLYLSSRLLKTIEACLLEGKTDTGAILNTLLARVVALIAATTMRWAIERIEPPLKSKVDNYFHLYLMQAQLLTDVPTSQESGPKVSAISMWRSFSGIVRFSSEVVGVAGQLALLVESSRSSGSPLFAAMCIAKPLILSLLWESFYTLPCLAYTDNEYRQRMQSLSSMTSTKYRSEIISGDLGNYVISEYKKALSSIGYISQEDVAMQYSSRSSSPMRAIFYQLLGDFPLIYFSTAAISNPTRFSMSSIAVMQQTSEDLEWSIDSILRNISYFQEQCQVLRNIYEAGDVKNLVRDGSTRYPRSVEEKNKGMSFEIRNLSFSYPGSQNIMPAISNISLSIEPGQLVVIVGGNGSGKSTIIKLLTRLYDPSSPPDSILVDGLPLSHYRMSDLHQAMAMLTQDHTIFPLSLGENIGLGCVPYVSNDSMVDHAAEMGGAKELLDKLEKGKDTVLPSRHEAIGSNIPDEQDHPLHILLKQLQKTIELSGGEKQRVVAARTFMRFESGTVKFVAVDEPSSALDAEGEELLFNNLLQAREGKTMIFVTHRFGRLTKHADLIVCMKDGAIAEVGTHANLMGLDGEYAKLYNIQARAFKDT
ncbi:P-loop containing nucleoside triphosphate hydrolase protein [Armillaria novae-zelandiae]|uniref:P-loop containing nucleoside triphosphate hydrolase protein n=1 Tax=Armillaria novae-zelandiae TaxID=153914 RepID=A0AA39PU85_9AGAR|nr:P-loop containing nucleoside triphosphate hydrolase protein [Armillaria novae-zelandiae]